MARIALESALSEWEKAISSATSEVIIVSPYITKNILERLIKHKNTHVYTDCSAMNFVSGASSIKAIMEAIRKGVAVYHLPNLHAKMVFVDGVWVSIGSQNITNRGHSHNKEATSFIDSQEIVSSALQAFSIWKSEARRLYLKELYYYEEDLSKASEIYKGLSFLAGKNENKFFGKMDLDVKQSIAMAEKLICEPIALDFARRLIESSCIWTNHPTAKKGYARSEGQGSNVECFGPGRFWWGPSGGDKLLISSAVDTCCDKYKKALLQGNTDIELLSSELIVLLRAAIRGPVYPPGIDGRGIINCFGNQKIRAPDFIEVLLGELKSPYLEDVKEFHIRKYGLMK